MVISLTHIVLGHSWLPDTQEVNASIDSEHRFYTALFMPYGAALVWVSRSVRTRLDVLNVVLAGLFLGGLARIVSVAVAGWPHALFVGLGIAELTVPPAVYWLGRSLKESIGDHVDFEVVGEH